MTSIPAQTGYCNFGTGHLAMPKTLCADTTTAFSGLHGPRAAHLLNSEKGTLFFAQIEMARDRLKELCQPIPTDGKEASELAQDPHLGMAADDVISVLEKALRIASNDSESGDLLSNAQPLHGTSGLFASAKELLWGPLQNRILTQIAEQPPAELGNGQTETTIQLQPEILGQLQMQFSSENDEVTLKISTQMPIVAQILQDHMAELKTALGNQGANMDTCHVSVAHGPHHPANDLLASAKELLWGPLQNRILTQIAEQPPAELGNGQTETTIQLQPEILGQLQMQFSSENDEVTLKISTQMPIVAQILQDHMGELKTALGNQGANMDTCHVSVVHGPHHPANDLLASAKELLWRPLQNQLLTQIAEQAPAELGNGQTETTIQLQPQAFSPLGLNIHSENGEVTLKISTHLPIVKEMLQDNTAEIRAALQRQGVEIDKCHVVASRDAQQYTSFKDHGDMAEAFISLNKNLQAGDMVQAGSSETENAHLLFHTPSLERTSDILVPAKQVLPRPLDTQIFTQIAEKAVLNINKGQNEMRLELKPAVLGHLRMHILTENDLVTLRISTHMPMVKEILESNIDQLKTALQDHGLEIEKFDVVVSHDSHEHARSHQNAYFQRPETEYRDNSEGNGSLPEVDEETAESDNNGTNLTLVDFFA
ncbi:MAG: flagellar hook-length control protein FliK [Thermodesulfobacteriota bacterium]|nr:flagellar hook-length control protein FliK [Thermodesulfobacteriota bacterium]